MHSSKDHSLPCASSLQYSSDQAEIMKLVSAISLLFAAVNATPLNLAESDLESLGKRDTEIVYLSNCLKSVSSGSPTASSEIIVRPNSIL